MPIVYRAPGAATCSPTRSQIPAAERRHRPGPIRGRARQLADVDQARSPLWTERSLRRHLETAARPARRRRRTRPRRLGGTLNTAFITAAAAAARRLTTATLGAPVDAAARRRWRSAPAPTASGGNAFSLDPDARADRRDADRRALRAIQTRPSTAKERQPARPALETLAAVAAALPTSLVTRLARQQAQTVDFATSNVRAAVPGLHRRRPIARELPDGPAGRRGLQPHPAVLRRQPRHGDQHRRRGGRRTRSCSGRAPGDGLRRAGRSAGRPDGLAVSCSSGWGRRSSDERTSSSRSATSLGRHQLACA